MRRPESDINIGEMNVVVAGIRTLLLIGGLVYLITQAESAIDDITSHYCRICENHTMCRFPYDDPGSNCVDIENGDLDDEEIKWILHWHNSFRNDIMKIWKNHGMWQSSRDMMQLLWNDELASIARRWVLQCNIYDKDKCRNVDRFVVMQNVNALDLEEVGNHSTVERLEFHIKTWYDRVNFSKRTSDFSMRSAGSPTGLATPTLTKMGCGRATYKVDLHEGEKLSQVEALVCNYWPIIKFQSKKSLDDGACKMYSEQFPDLCSKLYQGITTSTATATSTITTTDNERKYMSYLNVIDFFC